MTLWLMLLVAAPESEISYRIGFNQARERYRFMAIAQTIDGALQVSDRFGIGATIGIAYGSAVGAPWYTDSDLLVTRSRWFFGNPMVRATYLERWSALALRATTGVSIPVLEVSSPDYAWEDRATLEVISVQSGGYERWMWAPSAATWLNSLRVEGALGIFMLGAEAAALLMVQDGPRIGARAAGDVAIRPIELFEAGLRLQMAAMDGVHAMAAPWIGVHLGAFSASIHFNVELIDVVWAAEARAGIRL